MAGTVGVLPVGEEVLLRFFPLGFGPAVMTVTVADTHASAAVLLLGPFVAVA
jgi:hypothetical protein